MGGQRGLNLDKTFNKIILDTLGITVLEKQAGGEGGGGGAVSPRWV